MSGDLIIAVSNWMMHVIGSFGYLGVVFLMAVQSAAIPLPSEIIMPFSGFLVPAGQFSLIGLALAGGIGSVIGSLVTYYLGYFGGRPLVMKYGKYVLISQHDMDLTDRFFNRFASATFWGRMLPIIRSFISIPAGIAKAPLLPFILNAFVGSFIWSLALAYLGVKLGPNWPTIENYFRKFDLVIVIAVILVIIWWIRRHWKHRVGELTQ